MKLALTRALEHLNLGNAYTVYNVGNRAARNAAYYQRSAIPNQQARNSVVGRIDRDTHRALAEGWSLKH